MIGILERLANQIREHLFGPDGDIGTERCKAVDKVRNERDGALRRPMALLLEDPVERLNFPAMGSIVGIQLRRACLTLVDPDVRFAIDSCRQLGKRTIPETIEHQLLNRAFVGRPKGGIGHIHIAEDIA